GSQAGGEICCGDLERFVCGLDVFRLRLEDVVGLFEIEERAPHFGGNGAARGFERGHCRFPARARGLHPSFRRKSVEEMPGPVYPDEVAVVEFRAYRRISFVVNLVAGEKLDMRTQLAPVDEVLSIFDFDIFLARLDLSPVGIGPIKTLVYIGMKRCVLQLSGHFEPRLIWIRSKIESEKFAQAQIRIS